MSFDWNRVLILTKYSVSKFLDIITWCYPPWNMCSKSLYYGWHTPDRLVLRDKIDNILYHHCLRKTIMKKISKKYSSVRSFPNNVLWTNHVMCYTNQQLSFQRIVISLVSQLVNLLLKQIWGRQRKSGQTHNF